MPTAYDVDKVIFQSTLPLQEETITVDMRRFKSTFQSTLPLQEETSSHSDSVKRWLISIHSSFAGRDNDLIRRDIESEYFNPLFLCRKRRRNIPRGNALRRFQSTLPLQEETAYQYALEQKGYISIHSSFAGRDGAENKQEAMK